MTSEVSGALRQHQLFSQPFSSFCSRHVVELSVRSQPLCSKQRRQAASALCPPHGWAASYRPRAPLKLPPADFYVNNVTLAYTCNFFDHVSQLTPQTVKPNEITPWAWLLLVLPGRRLCLRNATAQGGREGTCPFAPSKGLARTCQNLKQQFRSSRFRLILLVGEFVGTGISCNTLSQRSNHDAAECQEQRYLNPRQRWASFSATQTSPIRVRTFGRVSFKECDFPSRFASSS